MVCIRVLNIPLLAQDHYLFSELIVLLNTSIEYFNMFYHQ